LLKLQADGFDKGRVPGDGGFKIGGLRGIGLHKKTIAVLGGKAKGGIACLVLFVMLNA
jgi:hypothetical protein